MKFTHGDNHSALLIRFPFAIARDMETKKHEGDVHGEQGYGYVVKVNEDTFDLPCIPILTDITEEVLKVCEAVGIGTPVEIRRVTTQAVPPDVIIADFDGTPAASQFRGGWRLLSAAKIMEGQPSQTLMGAILISKAHSFRPTALVRADTLTRGPVEAPCVRHVPEIMQYFSYAHLPPERQVVSKMFSELANSMLELPDCRQRQYALERLLEAKDGAVRASMFKAQ